MQVIETSNLRLCTNWRLYTFKRNEQFYISLTPEGPINDCLSLIPLNGKYVF